jgi:FkbM family methyltransferase
MGATSFSLRTRRLAGPRVLRALAAAVPDAFFVEAGANDGVKREHVREVVAASRWRGIVAEPVPHVFERLQRAYAGVPRVVAANVAVADADGRRPFHHLTPAVEGEPLPPWYDGVGSFSRETLLAHAPGIPGMEARLVTTEVETVTLPTLLARHGAPVPDLLVIDAEGHDAAILRSLDLAALHPRLVVYQHYHLHGDERAAVRALMESAGYATLEEGFDTFCADLGPTDALTREWRRTRPAVPGVSRGDTAA